MSSNSSYTPASWSPGVTSQTIYLQPQTSTGTLGDVYVFDCYFSVEIVSELRKTSHPVQTGGNVSDHAYLIPITVSFDVGMNDAGKSFNSSWDGSSTKSVNAYTVLRGLQEDRTLVNFSCKFGTFTNFLVDKVSPRLTSKNIYGMLATVTLSQIYMVSVTTQAVSVRSATTSTTSQGSSSTKSVSTSVSNNNKVTTSTPSGTTKSSYTSTNKSSQITNVDEITNNYDKILAKRV